MPAKVTGSRNAAPAPAKEETGLVKLSPPKGEQIDGGDVDEVIRLAPGESITGEYRGAKETKGAKPGEVSYLHKFIIEGNAVGMWGTVQLNAMLGKLKSGDNVWVGYEGKESLAGGNEMHRWQVVKVKGGNGVPF